MVIFDFLQKISADAQTFLLPCFRENLLQDVQKGLSLLPLEARKNIGTALQKMPLPKSGAFPLFVGGITIILLMLGEKKEFGRREAREKGEEIAEIARKFELENMMILPGILAQKEWLAFQEGVVLGTYEFNDWKGAKAKVDMAKRKNLKKILFWGESDKLRKKYLEILETAVKLTKDLVNIPPMAATPSFLAKTAQDLAKKLKKVSVKILGEKDLAKLGCGGILAVGNASHEESRLIILAYRGGKKEKPIALVGKGVTYDTGGLSLKPGQHMATMKQDLAGAATVLGAFYGIAASGVAKNVIAVIPTVENLVNHAAYKPDDVLTMYNGKTVEITNTDAEGRLILADAIAYAEEKFAPRAMVDLATLTGSCIYAVGDDFTAALGNDQKLMKEITDSGKETDELIWELPLHARYKKHIDSKVADMVNSSMKFKAGTIEAGLFLQHFISEKTPWCHLDIASVAFNDAERMATGRDVRMLWRFVEKS